MVKRLSNFVDMTMDDKEKQEYINPSANPPKYPYGLCVSLCEDELEKLGLDAEELALGDMLHLHALAKVTSVSKNDTEHGSHERVELVLAYIQCEDEGEEDKKVDKTKKLYK